MINIFSIALLANETREVALVGEYFEIRSAVYPITKIELTDRSGGLVSVIDAALESDFVRPGRYETMRITNGATPQTVSFWYGSGDAGSRRFSGNVTGSVSLIGQQGPFGNAQKSVGIASAQIIAANLLRRYLLIQNNDPSIDIWVRMDGGTAAINGSGSTKIAAGGVYELKGFVPNGAVTAIAALVNNNIATLEG